MNRAFARGVAFFGAAVLTAAFVEPGTQWWSCIVGSAMLGVGAALGWEDE